MLKLNKVEIYTLYNAKRYCAYLYRKMLRKVVKVIAKVDIPIDDNIETKIWRTDYINGIQVTTYDIKFNLYNEYICDILIAKMNDIIEVVVDTQSHADRKILRDVLIKEFGDGIGVYSQYRKLTISTFDEEVANKVRLLCNKYGYKNGK